MLPKDILNFLISFYLNTIKFHPPFELQIVRECRGLILDEANNWGIVSFPFTKFFNYGEPNAAKIDWDTARVLEKKDGSLLILYPYNNEYQVQTSGSPDAGGDVNDFGMTFAELFWETFNSYEQKLPPIECGITFWMELCAPYNKIVVRHDKPSLTILGGRNLSTNTELTLQEVSAYLPKIPAVQSFSLSSIEECVSSFQTFSGKDQEGYVVVDANFNRIKLKHPEYLHLHRLKDGLSSKRALIEVVRNGDLDEIISSLPEFTDILLEAKGKLDALVLELETSYNIIKDIASQKEFASLALKSKCSAALFQLRSKKVRSIREYFSTCHIDSAMSLLGYKTNE